MPTGPNPLRAIDLFAGTGWGIACKWLGMQEMGVENMPEAIATREANGMPTIYRDVWDGLDGRFYIPKHEVVIASPPCQTFSPAGNGTGRAALDDVLEAIEVHAYKDPDALHAFGVKHDPRTALVLTPLAHVHRDRPEYVVLEQVPAVLPAWNAYAEVMRDMGYDVKVEMLHAEQYGVPQTRKRAILIARLGGTAILPTITHSRYYNQTPEKMDPGVLPWVSMGEALGRPQSTDYLRSNYGTGGDPRRRGIRRMDQPAPTMTSKADRNKWNGETPLTLEEASTLQTYPPGFKWEGSRTRAMLQVGNAVPPLLAEAILSALTGARPSW